MHIKWTSIESFHNVKKNINTYKHHCVEEGKPFEYPTIKYRAKVKLDGINAGVQIKKNGQVFAQSRSKIITPGDDNYGFAKWVEENKEYFAELSWLCPVTVFGEWCGSGIQKRCSISKTKDKYFAVFAIQVGSGDKASLFVDPLELKAILINKARIPSNLFVIPWLDITPFTIDFGDKEDIDNKINKLEQIVNDVETCDPLVKELFGVEGLGEGIVLYPDRGLGNKEKYTKYMFKAKGEKHKVVREKKTIVIDPEQVEGIEEFVEKFVTPQRLEQGLTEASGGEFDMKKLGNFLKWLGEDVKKESKDERELANLHWKHVQKSVTNKARQWFMNGEKE